MDPLSPHARAMLAAYRDERPGVERRADNWAAVRRQVVPGASRGWWVGAWVVLAAAAAALVLVLMLAPEQMQLGAREHTPEAIDRAAITPGHAIDDHTGVTPAQFTAQPRASTPAVQPAAQDRPVPAPPKVAAKPPAATAVVDDALDLQAETRLVARMRTAIVAHDDAAAKAAIAEHAERFARGMFVEERDAYAVVLACRADPERAHAARQAFDAQHPRSHHDKAIRSACETVRDPARP